jgi:hypothetical protein
MQVQVERRPGHLGGEMPVPFRLGGREIEIVENVDQWYGPDYCFVAERKSAQSSD